MELYLREYLREFPRSVHLHSLDLAVHDCVQENEIMNDTVH